MESMRPLSGGVLIDKQKGPTCNQIDIWIRKFLKMKVAHVGTLDPGATGVLLILFGKAIKLQEYLQKEDKEYICLMELEKKVDLKKLEEVFKDFVGEIYQRPPKMSAVSKRIRIRKIYWIKILEVKENFVLFHVKCQHGTYIRSLVEHIGLVLGLKTKLLELRRIKSGCWSEDMCIPLIRFKDSFILLEKGKKEVWEKNILSLEDLVKDLKKIYLNEDGYKRAKNGRSIGEEHFIKKENIREKEPIALFYKDKVIAIGFLREDKRIKVEKVLV
ncbi:MAG: RNA-guided pseudouridylation complex pseudouridine synthase subunit Cbf5 [archaeon]